MKQKICIECKHVIINDLEKYVKKFPKENYVQCANPLCGVIQKLK